MSRFKMQHYQQQQNTTETDALLSVTVLVTAEIYFLTLLNISVIILISSLVT